MNRTIFTQLLSDQRRMALCFLLAIALGACATTDTSLTPARIQLQEAVGFTITEEVRISGSVRADYEEALKVLERGQQLDPRRQPSILQRLTLDSASPFWSLNALQT